MRALKGLRTKPRRLRCPAGFYAAGPAALPEVRWDAAHFLQIRNAINQLYRRIAPNP
jgi:hypothetical protein